MLWDLGSWLSSLPSISTPPMLSSVRSSPLPICDSAIICMAWTVYVSAEGLIYVFFIFLVACRVLNIYIICGVLLVETPLFYHQFAVNDVYTLLGACQFLTGQIVDGTIIFLFLLAEVIDASGIVVPYHGDELA